MSLFVPPITLQARATSFVAIEGLVFSSSSHVLRLVSILKHPYHNNDNSNNRILVAFTLFPRFTPLVTGHTCRNSGLWISSYAVALP